MTHSVPPSFLRKIPTRLLRRRGNAGADLRRANELVAHCDEAGYHPSFLELERERARR